MLSDRSIREYFEKGWLRVVDRNGRDLDSIDRFLQPNSLEVPTREILTDSGEPAQKEKGGWILRRGETYVALPDILFAAGSDMPRQWVPTHAQITPKGVVRPMQEFVEFESDRLLLPRKGITLGARNPIKVHNYYHSFLGKRAGGFAEEYDLVMLQSNAILIGRVREALEKQGVEADRDEPIYAEDVLRIKAISFPRSGIQRRGISLDFDPEELKFGDMLGQTPLELRAKITPEFNTFVPRGYSLQHVAFDTNLGQESYFAQNALDLGLLGVSPAVPEKLTRFGVLLTPDESTIKRLRDTEKVMRLGEPVDEGTFFEHVGLDSIGFDDKFILSSTEKLKLGQGVVGFAGGYASLALRTVDKLNYDPQWTRYQAIPYGAHLNGPFHLFTTGGPPPKGTIEVECVGQSTGIIDSGLEGTITSIHRMPNRLLAGRWLELFREGRLPLLFIAFENNDQPVERLYGQAGNNYQGAGEGARV